LDDLDEVTRRVLHHDHAADGSDLDRRAAARHDRRAELFQAREGPVEIANRRHERDGTRVLHAARTGSRFSFETSMISTPPAIDGARPIW
jgi:hypothetical protein